METPVGLIDMDGTLYDYAGQLRRDLLKLKSPNEILPQNLWDESLPWLKARMSLIKSQPGWWLNLPRLEPPLGWQIYEMAREIGFDIKIFTKGPASKSQAWAEKHTRILQDFGSDVSFCADSENKSSVYGHFLCDDYTPYLSGWLNHRPRGLAIVIANQTNDYWDHPNAIRYDGTNQEEIRRALRAVFKRKSGQHWKDLLE